MAETTILIPVDFSIESLNTLKLALSQTGSGKVHVILMYAEGMSDSIMELLFYMPQKTIKAMTSPGFEEAIAIIQNRYENKIASLKIELFHGYTANALETFTDAKGVDIIYIPQNYTFKLKRNGFDPLPLLSRSKLPVETVSWDSYPDWSEKDQLSTLFI